MKACFATEPTETWLSATVAAFCAARDASSTKAAGHWSQAVTLTSDYQKNDPRIAATWHNAGVAMLIEQRYECAVRNFVRARESWGDALKWIEVVDIPLAGRGSTFHFQLAAEHSDAFTRARRQRLIGLCLGAGAITNVLNRLAHHWMQAASLTHAAFETDLSVIAAAFGGSCQEIDLVRQVIDGTEPIQNTSKPSLFERWQRDSVQSGDQLSDFFASIFLTAGLHPSHIPWKDHIGRGGAPKPCRQYHFG